MDADKQIKREVDALVSSTSGCDRDGCRCWQAVSDLKKIKEYCEAEIKKSVHEDLK